MPAFMRQIELQVSGNEIKYYPERDEPGLVIEFEINFKDDSEGNIGYIDIYNLAESSIDNIENGDELILKAGYEGDVGTLLPGVVEKVYSRYEGVEKRTELIVGDHTDKWLTHTINRAWAEGKDAETVAQDIINELPFQLGEFDPAENVTYENGKTFSTLSKTALEEIASDTGSKLHVSRGEIFFRPPNKGTEEIPYLSKETGLIATPEKGHDEGEVIYDVQSLLNYRIWADEVIEIDSKTASGTFRVKDGRHVHSGDDFLTEMEVVPY